MGRLWMFIIVFWRNRGVQFPLSFLDITLVLALVTIVLLITSELASQYLGRMSLAIEKKLLRRAALVFGFAFLVTVALRVYEIISKV